MREIGVPKNFAKFTGKKETLFKKRLWHRFCRVNFAKSLEHHFYRTPPDECFWTQSIVESCFMDCGIGVLAWHRLINNFQRILCQQINFKFLETFETKPLVASGFDLMGRDSWFTTRFWIFTTEFFVIMSLFTTR